MPDAQLPRVGDRIRVLYVVYWGAAEPLGQSLILPSVRELVAAGADLTLVTFEKSSDLRRSAETARARQLLADAGVTWIPLRYHKRPKWPATLWDALLALRAGAAAHRRQPFDLVHARTFVAGVMGLLLARLIGARLVFHNEGFYPDEQVDAGVWREGSLPHRLARWMEGRLYDHADGIIVLSHRASRVVAGRPGVRARSIPVIVVPSCVDLTLFREASARSRANPRADGLRLVYLGSTGGRYRFDQVGPFAATARRLVGRVHVRVLTPTPPRRVAELLKEAGLRDGEFSVGRVEHEAMPGELERQHAGLSFYARGLSEHACSPTKIGEYWAAGLPVVVSPNLSDAAEVIRCERVGVVLTDSSPSAHEQAAGELLRLLEDPQLPVRCRRAAEAHYGLKPASALQAALYAVLVPSQGRRR